MAMLKTITRPWWNGCEISCGKNALPVSTATLPGGRWLRTPVGVSSCLTGL